MLTRVRLVEYRHKIRYVREKILKMTRQEFADLLNSKYSYIVSMENHKDRRMGRAKEEILIKAANLPERFFSDEEINVLEQAEITDAQMFYRLFPNAKEAKVSIEVVRKMIDLIKSSRNE